MAAVHSAERTSSVYHYVSTTQYAEKDEKEENGKERG